MQHLPRILACLLVLMTVARAAVAGSITTVAGSAGGGPALAVAQVPDAVAVHGAFIYVADYFSHVVWRLDTATGEEVVVAGTGGGTSFGGDGGPATAAQLGFPLGVAVDAAGNLAIADQSNDRIRLVNATTGVITTVAGKESSGFSGDGGPATAAELYLPAGVTFGAAGDLFIADQQNNRIRRVDATAGIITTVAGNGSAGFSGDGGPATAAQLQYPYSVTLDATGNIFISDGNDRIRRVDATTGIITTVAGNGSAGLSGDGGLATAAQLNAPSGVAFDAAQNLFIADRFNSRIRRVDAATGTITTVAGDGTFGFGGDGGPATAAQLNYPYSVGVDAAGNVLIPDTTNERLRRIDARTGIITTIAGNGTPSFSGDGGPATTAQIGFVPGVAVDPAGNLFITDHNAQRIRRVDAATGIITTVAGNGTAGFGGDDGPATAAQLTDPSGIALDASGNLFIADRLRVRRVEASTGVITTIAGNGNCCFSGDGGPATAAGLDYCLNVAVDIAGNVFTAEPCNNHRVRRVDATTGIITTVAGNGVHGFSGDGGPATAAELGSPVAVAVDAAGNVLIADTFRVRRVDATSGIITTIAGNGMFPPDSGDGGPATDAQLAAVGLAFDAAGNLFIADADRIRRIDANTGIISTVAGTGIRGYSGDGGPAIAAQLYEPLGLAFDTAGNLFVADAWNYRVRRVPSPVPCGDVNGDGVVNIGDALITAQYDVGLHRCRQAPFNHPEVCDVNRDGVCNIGDALKMAQCDVGLISCVFTCGTFACPSATTTTTTTLPGTTTTTMRATPCGGQCAGCGKCGAGVCVTAGGTSCGHVGSGDVCVDGHSCTASSCTADSDCGAGTVCVVEGHGVRYCCSTCS